MFTETDLEQIRRRGSTPEQVTEQLNRFASGFPTLRIVASAQVGHGILRLTEEEENAALDRWNDYLAAGGEVLKFVPASGAASRMFKALFEFADSDSDTFAEGSAAHIFIHHIHSFAFASQLDEACRRIHGLGIDALAAAGRNRDIVRALLSPEGLNYGGLPKGLLLFHLYPDAPRTPLEEQIVEGAQTAANADGIVRLHFTVSEEHRPLFEKKIAEVTPEAERRLGVKIEISLSEQKHSTDTIAATPEGTPFRNDDGSLLFRPGGHGALIENLNDIDSAVVFIKNIDNVVPDSKRESTIRYKRIIAGLLMQVYDRIETSLALLDGVTPDSDTLDRIADFARTTLCIADPRLDGDDDAVRAKFLREKLDRPLRVCGMVKNEGEPGGGPYITVNPDGSASPQILESTQIAPEYAHLMAEATHFNPVDLVCYTKDTNGHRFRLPEYVDPDTGFISEKSQHGRELRALELPGLWNGAMSDWNTVFVEVPISTFNPVKTVNDLLRPIHQ